MWDNAVLLRSFANTLYGLSVLAILYGAIHYLVHYPELFPLRSVVLSDVPNRVDKDEVLHMVRSEALGNLFTVDIDHVRQSLEKLMWVRSVSVRREFPYRLVVQLKEHQALATWNNSALVNQQGEVFTVRPGEISAKRKTLPTFIGPEGASEEVTQRYEQFSEQIMPLKWRASQIALSARHAWQLRLDNGMVLELGRDDMQHRLARFVAAQGAVDLGNVKYVDLRYRKGFAVRQGNRG